MSQFHHNKISGVTVVTYEEGRVFVSLSEGGTLKDVRRQLCLGDEQKFCCRGIQCPSELEARPCSEWLLSDIIEKQRQAETDFFAQSEIPKQPIIEVSPRGFTFPESDFCFAGLTTAQRLFGAAATSVRVLSAKQAKAGTVPLRFFICARIKDWAGSGVRSEATENELNFATAVVREIALLLAARGCTDVPQIKSLYFDKRDLYCIVDEGPVSSVCDIATFISSYLFKSEGNEILSSEALDQQAELQALEAARQILDAVVHLHELDVVHGSLTPRAIIASRVNFLGNGFWRFAVRDLGIIERAAHDFRRREQLCERKPLVGGSRSFQYASWSTSSLGTGTTGGSADKKSKGGGEGQPPAAFYKQEEIDDHTLCLRYSSPEILVTSYGPHISKAADIFSAGMILSELFGSLLKRRLDPVIEEVGLGSFRRDNFAGGLGSGFDKRETINKQHLFERLTAGSGFSVSFKEARDRYAAVGTNVSQAAPSNIWKRMSNNNNNNNSQDLAAAYAHAESSTSRQHHHNTSSSSSSEQQRQQQEGEQSVSSSNSNNKTSLRFSSYRSPLDAKQGEAVVESTRNSNKMNFGATDGAFHRKRLSQETSPSSYEHSVVVAQNEEEEERQRKLGATALSPGRRVNSHQGDFARYLDCRNLSSELSSTLLSMISFYPEARPTALRLRQTGSVLFTSQKYSSSSVAPPKTSALVRLAYAQKLDQSELHQAILSLLNSLGKPQEQQRQKLCLVAELIQNLIKSGSLKDTFGTSLSRILLSRSGARKIENDRDNVKLNDVTSSSSSQQQQQQQQQQRKGGENDEEEIDENEDKEFAVFGGVNRNFSGMNILRDLAEILMHLAVSK